MDKQYLGILDDILANGVQKGDRTGTERCRFLDRMYRHDLSEGFPF